MTDQPPIARPPSPSGSDKGHSGFKPSDYNPDLANTEMVREMMLKLPTPTIVSKKFTVFQGMVKALKHKPPTYKDVDISDDIEEIKGRIVGEIVGKPGYLRVVVDEGNTTYIDLSLLSVVLDEVSRQSVNVEGSLFKNFWAYMMHPTFIIQGMPNTGQVTEEQQPGFFGRIMNRLRGKDTSQGATSQ